VNLLYLGDALDHWKGLLFERLQHTGLLTDFAVDAMASDPDDWDQDDLNLYRTLLRIQPVQLVEHKHRLPIDPLAYFKEIPRRGDLFLDPDTGVATCKVSIPSQYLTVEDVHDLPDHDGKRLLAVYQHVRAQKTRVRLQRVVASLRLLPKPFSCWSYESGTVAMLFLSRTADRVDEVVRHLGTLLKDRAEQRVSLWRHMQDAEPRAPAHRPTRLTIPPASAAPSA
jgi:hypothetical protein